MVDPVSLDAVVAFLDECLDVAKFDEPEESNGLVVRAAERVGRVAAAVNTTFATTDAAAKEKADLLLVHHRSWPSIDHGLAREKERRLLDARISLYCAHAALDCAPEIGNADRLAALVGVRVERRFAAYHGGHAGVIGRTEGTFAEFVERLRAALGVPVDAWENTTTFGTVAVTTGAGGLTNVLEEARTLGADTFVTGEGNMYTKLYARERGMNLAFGSHWATEQFGVQALAALLAERFGLPWSFLGEDPHYR